MNGWHQQLANKTAVALVIVANAELAKHFNSERMEPEVQSAVQALLSDVLLMIFWVAILFGGLIAVFVKKRWGVEPPAPPPAEAQPTAAGAQQ